MNNFLIWLLNKKIEEIQKEYDTIENPYSQYKFIKQWTLYSIIENLKEQLKEQEILRNVLIIKNLRYTHKDKKRKQIAIYRLYRNFDLKPSKIAYLVNIKCHRVRYAIGETFKRLCLKEQCIFSKFLENEK